MITSTCYCDFDETFDLYSYANIELKQCTVSKTNNKLILLLDKKSTFNCVGLIVQEKEKLITVKIISKKFESEGYKDFRHSNNEILLVEENKLSGEIELYIENISDYLSICFSMEEKTIYRGQADSCWSIEPSIFRKGNQNNNINIEQQMFVDMKQWNIKDFTSENYICNACNMQHYGIPTRLIDWTTNCLNALYFATVSPSEDTKDGTIFCVSANKVHEIESSKYKQVEDFIKYRYFEKNNLTQNIEDILIEYAIDSKNTVFFKTAYSNDRIRNQEGIFSIFIDITEDEAKYLVNKRLQKILSEIIKKLMHDDEISSIEEEKVNRLIKLDIESMTHRIEDKENIYKTFLARLVENCSSKIDKEKLRTTLFNELDRACLEKIKSKKHKMSSILQNEKSIKIIVQSDKKSEMIKSLDSCGINSRVVYPDLEGLMKYMKEKYV
ncbi:FRG domain-containing protein [Clostridium estertheticum]|uniref:FRG domain-containing protein n=1 Tax=Clostridium estertheticum TaxID=238834 RepID=UPI001C0B3857|nr:FRG domain-containing protein [Clostridium estertheticum]MBU3072831.1 FRG domain-containing protein [Clostridium estertheticum]MBU3163132.1 FRG domain-containing protein [Clostridium estertheticum]MBX4272103.1 FRG domain-containing protein [Clostridium estertheticum]WLC78894.1 FRG domain-containing protein [Clostridium estertheticum]